MGDVAYAGEVGPPANAGVAPDGIGVTPGGVQDIEYAREQVASGTLPPAESITVEGLLSQHDLPAGGTACEDLLCLRPALGATRSADTNELTYWVYLGMKSGLTDFQRPPLDLTIVMDRSSSMSGDMRETEQAVVNMLEQLRPDDSVSIIAFNDRRRVVFEHGPLTDLASVSRDVLSIEARGSWEIEPALEQALAVQRAAGNSPERLRRIVVLSCGYPDAAASSPFAQLVADAAGERIGFTFLGILLGYDATLGELLGQTPGGSYHYVQNLESTREFFGADFDTMMSPLAYDLSMRLDLGAGFTIDRAFGIPGDSVGAPSASLEVATAFTSRRGGGIVVRLRRSGAFDQELGQVGLSYTPESAFGWTAIHSENKPLRLPVEAATDVFWGTDTVQKAVALVEAAEGMRDALGLRESGARDEALARMTQVLDELRSAAAALDDEGLRTELAFAEALTALM